MGAEQHFQTHSTHWNEIALHRFLTQDEVTECQLVVRECQTRIEVSKVHHCKSLHEYRRMRWKKDFEIHSRNWNGDENFHFICQGKHGVIGVSRKFESSSLNDRLEMNAGNFTVEHFSLEISRWKRNNISKLTPHIEMKSCLVVCSLNMQWRSVNWLFVNARGESKSRRFTTVNIYMNIDGWGARKTLRFIQDTEMETNIFISYAKGNTEWLHVTEVWVVVFRWQTRNERW